MHGHKSTAKVRIQRSQLRIQAVPHEPVADPAPAADRPATPPSVAEPGAKSDVTFRGRFRRSPTRRRSVQSCPAAEPILAIIATITVNVADARLHRVGIIIESAATNGCSRAAAPRPVA